jgi:hypothetical protein
MKDEAAPRVSRCTAEISRRAGANAVSALFTAPLAPTAHAQTTNYRSISTNATAYSVGTITATNGSNPAFLAPGA